MQLHIETLEFPRPPSRPWKSMFLFSYFRGPLVFLHSFSPPKTGVTRCVGFLAHAPPGFQTWVQMHKAQQNSLGSTDQLRLMLHDLAWWPSAEHGTNAHYSRPWPCRVTPHPLHFATQQFPPNPINKSNFPHRNRKQTMVTKGEREMGEREMRSMKLTDTHDYT